MNWVRLLSPGLVVVPLETSYDESSAELVELAPREWTLSLSASSRKGNDGEATAELVELAPPEWTLDTGAPSRTRSDGGSSAELVELARTSGPWT